MTNDFSEKFFKGFIESIESILWKTEMWLTLSSLLELIHFISNKWIAFERNKY